MAIYEYKFKVQLRDVGKGNEITNKGLLSYLEDTATMHSEKIGYGINNIGKTGVTWVLLNWKVQVFKRPIFGDDILVKTWVRNIMKFYTFRDFEVYDSNNTLVAIATTKWVLLDAQTMKLARISDEMIIGYAQENKNVFENDDEIGKITFTDTCSSIKLYEIQRKDIDINRHVHNTTYLDFAYEVLPFEIYNNANFNRFEVMYKKEIKLGETIKTFYTREKNSHYIVIKSEDGSILHAVIRLDEI